jgi:hypothetical protein
MQVHFSAAQDHMEEPLEKKGLQLPVKGEKGQLDK